MDDRDEPRTGRVRIIGAEPVGDARSPDDEGAPGELDDDAVLPHWTEAPTGQVPAVLSGGEQEDDNPWRSVPTPTWREERSDWAANEEAFDPSLLAATDEAAEEEGERQPWSFDLDPMAQTSVVPVVGRGAHAARRAEELFGDLSEPDPYEDDDHWHYDDPVTGPVAAARPPDRPGARSDAGETVADGAGRESAGDDRWDASAEDDRWDASAEDDRWDTYAERESAGDDRWDTYAERESAGDDRWGTSAEREGTSAERESAVDDRWGTSTERGGTSAERESAVDDRWGTSAADEDTGEHPSAAVVEPSGPGVPDGVGVAASLHHPGRGARVGEDDVGDGGADEEGTNVEEDGEPAGARRAGRRGGPVRLVTPRGVLGRRPPSPRSPAAGEAAAAGTGAAAAGMVGATGIGPSGAPRRPVRRVDHEPSGPPGGRNIPVAIVSGVVLGGVALLCFAFGTVTSMVVVTAVVGLAAAEGYAAFRKAGYHPATLLGLGAVVGVLVGVYNRGEAAEPLVVVLLVAFTLLWHLLRVDKGADPVRSTLSTLFVYCWVGVFGSYAALLLSPTVFPHRHGIAYLLGAVITVVAYDVAALGVGSWVGHRPLSAISPNKTWEGLIGGTVVAIVVAVMVVHLIHPWTIGKAAALGVAVAVLAPIGDLAESLVKRHVGVKDMGRVLPGHGGLLDRVDGLLFVLPATYYLMRVFHVG